MFGLIKTHKENNPARVITRGHGTAIEFLSTFVEKYLYKEVVKINSRIKDTPDMLDITDDNNNNNNMIMNTNPVSNVITQCFDNVFYLLENGTARGLCMSYSYSDIAMYRFDIKAFN